MTLPETQELQTTRRQRIDKDRNRKKIERNRAKKLQQVEAELRKKTIERNSVKRKIATEHRRFLEMNTSLIDEITYSACVQLSEQNEIEAILNPLCNAIFRSMLHPELEAFELKHRLKTLKQSENLLILEIEKLNTQKNDLEAIFSALQTTIEN